MHIKEEAYDGGAAYTMKCASLTSGELDAVHDTILIRERIIST